MSLVSIYEKIEEETEPKVSLVIKAYGKVSELLREACGEIPASGNYNPLSRAAAIITELLSGLDFEKGGQIAKNLKELYLFSLGKIVEAEKRGDTSELGGIAKMFEDLKGAWEHVGSEYLKGS